MKSSTVFSLLALAATAASSPLAAPELEDRTFFPTGCSVDNKILILAGLSPEFCSAYLQPTSTATVVKTALSTAFATATTTQTIQITTTATPAPTSPALVCDVPGFATAGAVTTFFNNDGSFTLAQCQAQCVSLGAGTFASGSGLCACYAGKPADVVAPAAGSPYTFSDVTCPLPASTPVKRGAAPTCAPASSKVPPFWIQKLNASPARISSACECLLNQKTPAACVVTKYSTVTATTTVVQVETATATQTVTVTAA
ncbi:hypothetical protein BKA65DRAFT_535650 [Rhexocercosporidium sp. MPI-PUGE-AT-0058]|nr:hypothetical protein BKA65DRAFT_535650 [Rhexocercosporidium sp. MPI-PUGE-AT-0058]